MPEFANIASPKTTAVPAADSREPVPANKDTLVTENGVPYAGIQAKLAVGAPNDSYEKEADTMADTIMRMPEQNFIQRKCAHCGEEEKLQRKPLASFIQRKGSAEGITASDAVSNQINASKGSGSNMDSNTQSFMQNRFGADFSDVKIHTGGEAIQMNRELNAKAFTVGRDIYFNEGQYNPGATEGKHLLAHELTHTVQQNAVRSETGGSSNNFFIQRAITSRCYSPMVWFGPTGAPGLGMLAEKLIELDYMRSMGAIYMANAYFDNSLAGSIDPMYVLFLIRKNPSMPAWAKVAVISTSLARPDMMIHTPALQEFDEIKPDSPTGVPAGLAKIAIINWYMARFSLPYTMGTTYVPSPIINIASTTIAGTPIRFYLQVRRHSPGLILYELCIETDWALVTKAAAILLLIAIIAAILAGLPIPAPVPLPV